MKLDKETIVEFVDEVISKLLEEENKKDNNKTCRI